MASLEEASNANVKGGEARSLVFGGELRVEKRERNCFSYKRERAT